MRHYHQFLLLWYFWTYWWNLHKSYSWFHYRFMADIQFFVCWWNLLNPKSDLFCSIFHCTIYLTRDFWAVKFFHGYHLHLLQQHSILCSFHHWQDPFLIAEVRHQISRMQSSHILFHKQRLNSSITFLRWSCASNECFWLALLSSHGEVLQGILFIFFDNFHEL